MKLKPVQEYTQAKTLGFLNDILPPLTQVSEIANQNNRMRITAEFFPHTRLHLLQIMTTIVIK